MSERPFYEGTTSTFDSQYAKQTSRQIQIKNQSGNLLYIINQKYKNDQFDEDFLNYEHDFLVYVDSFLSGHQTVLSSWFDYQSDAEDFFNLNVDIYKALAIAASKGERNIEIYADKIKYYIIKPDCCKYCKYAKPTLQKYQYVYDQLKPISIDVEQIELSDETTVQVSNIIDCVISWQCTNPNLFKLPDIPGRDMSISAAHYTPVYPYVSDNGICKDFERVTVYDQINSNNVNPYNCDMSNDSLKNKVNQLVQEEFRRLQREYENDIQVVSGGTAENDK